MPRKASGSPTSAPTTQQQLKASSARRDIRRASVTAAPTASTRWLCLQGFKDLLIDNGMQIFESTEMERLEDHTVYTHAGSVTADQIIIAVDKLRTRSVRWPTRSFMRRPS